jgi:hypothetical protein
MLQKSETVEVDVDEILRYDRELLQTATQTLRRTGNSASS